MTRSTQFWLLAIALVASSPVHAASSSLEQAYKKEFAFLEAEKRALKQGLRDLKKETARRASKARQEVARLEAQLKSQEEAASKTQAAIDALSSEDNPSSDDTARLDEMVERALVAFQDSGVPQPSLEPLEEGASKRTPQQLQRATAQIFEASGPLVARSRSVWTEDGAFFDSQGSELKGHVVHLGRVARYGVAGDVSGALAPAGAGRFKLWPDASGQTAAALKAGERPPELEVFLYESAAKAVEKKEEKTALMIIESGGVIAWVIVGLGIFALVLALLRVMSLLYLGAGTRAVVSSVSVALTQGGVGAAQSVCGRVRLSVRRVLSAALSQLSAGREMLDSAVEEAILCETPKIERFGTAMTVVAAVAPLLGLLGTVTGMIATFDVITEHGTGDPKMLSGGISEALVTTELGLIVAIPTLMLGAFLSTWGDRLLTSLEAGALHVINRAAVLGLREQDEQIASGEPSETTVEVDRVEAA